MFKQSLNAGITFMTADTIHLNLRETFINFLRGVPCYLQGATSEQV